MFVINNMQIDKWCDEEINDVLLYMSFCLGGMPACLRDYDVVHMSASVDRSQVSCASKLLVDANQPSVSSHPS